MRERPSPPTSSSKYEQKLKSSSQIEKEGDTSASCRSSNRKLECCNDDNKNSTSSQHLNNQQPTTTSFGSIPNVVDFGTVNEQIEDELNRKVSREPLNSASHPSSLANLKSPSQEYINAIAERIFGAVKSTQVKIDKLFENKNLFIIFRVSQKK